MSYFLVLLAIIYVLFLHIAMGEFKTCDFEKYPTQVICFKEQS